MNVYWIDSYEEYDPVLVKSVLNLFEYEYTPLLQKLGLSFKVVDIHQIRMRNDSLFLEEIDLNDTQCIAYINTINPSLKTQELQEQIYKKAINLKNLSVLNYVKSFPFIDRNKMLASEIAKSLSIPIVNSVIIKEPKKVSEYLQEIEGKFDYPIIVKPIDMFGGIGVLPINNSRILASMLEVLMFSSRTFIAQPKLKIKSDCRIYVGKYEYIACLSRVPKDENELGNISKGASSYSIKPPDKVIEMSLKIAKEISSNFLCVDWFQCENEEYLFSEIETAGGFVQLPTEEKMAVAKNLFHWKSNA